MNLSKHQQENIVTRVLTDVSKLGTVAKRKQVRIDFENWIEQFTNQELDDIISDVELILDIQFESMENACIAQYDYIRLTGLGNLKTNWARQEILKHLEEHGTTLKEDIQPIKEKYIEMLKANKTQVELDIKLDVYEQEIT